MSRRPYGYRCAIALLLITAPMCLACAHGASRRARPPLPEDALATAMLLTLNDVGSGWLDHPPSLPLSPDPCRPAAPAGETGRAATGFRQAEGEHARLEEYVVLFDTAEHATAPLETYPAVSQCFIARSDRGEFDTGGWRYTQATFSHVGSPPYGERAEKYRFQHRVTGKRLQGSTLHAYAQVVLFVVGRVAVQVNADNTYGAPFDPSALNQLVGVAQERIQQDRAR